jgi:hypothetical protein
MDFGIVTAKIDEIGFITRAENPESLTIMEVGS